MAAYPQERATKLEVGGRVGCVFYVLILCFRRILMLCRNTPCVRLFAPPLLHPLPVLVNDQREHPSSSLPLMSVSQSVSPGNSTCVTDIGRSVRMSRKLGWVGRCVCPGNSVGSVGRCVCPGNSTCVTDIGGEGGEGVNFCKRRGVNFCKRR